MGVFPLSVELISVGGNDDERVGNTKWTRATSKTKPASGDSWATAKDLKLVGEDSISMGKAWHLKGTANDQPFELWVRESDGYPLKYMNDDPNASLMLTFDRFNTGQRVSEPAPSDIKPEPKTITGAIGQPRYGRLAWPWWPGSGGVRGPATASIPIHGRDSYWSLVRARIWPADAPCGAALPDTSGYARRPDGGQVVTVAHKTDAGSRVTVSWLNDTPARSSIIGRRVAGHTVLLVRSQSGTAVVAGDAPEPTLHSIAAQLQARPQLGLIEKAIAATLRCCTDDAGEARHSPQRLR